MASTAPDQVNQATDTYRSIHQCIEDHVRSHGDAVAIHSIEQDKEITWRGLSRLCNQIAHFFKDKGLKANDRVVVFSDTSLEALALFIAVWRYGLTISSINIEMNHQHLDYILGSLKPKLVFYDREMDPDSLTKSRPGEWIAFGDWVEGAPASCGPFFDSLPGPDGLALLPPAGGREAFSTVMFTSGTTDRPKGVVQQYESYYRVGEAAVERWKFTADDVFMEYRSFGWGSPQMLCLLPALNAGAKMVVARKFSASRFFDWVRSYRPTIIAGVPTVINMLLNRDQPLPPGTFDSLRFMTSSSAPLLPEQHVRFEETYGVSLVPLYGMSEGGFLAGNPPDKRKIGTVGPPALHQEIRILDADGKSLPQGETGEIEIGGGQRAYGYLQPDGTVEPLPGRRISTGDIGFIDADGYLTITGRVKDLIIRGGVNIAPLEIDNALLADPTIAEAATIGVADPIYGEEVVSFVAPAPGASPTEDAVRAHCRARLAEAKVPKRVVFVQSIPKNDRGKVDKARLAAMWKEIAGVA